MPNDTQGPEPIGKMGKGGWTKTIRTTWLPDIDASYKIRIERLKRELKLEDRAASDGQQNLPGKADKTLNEPQLEICSRVFSGILLLNQFLREQIGSATAGARKLLVPELNTDRLKAKIASQIDEVFLERRSELIQLRRADLGRHRTLRFFRFKNSLNREAHYRDSIVFVAGLMTFVFVGESVLNGALLSEVMSSGFVGGALLAAVISGINIASGIAAGLYGWRLLGHKEPGRKVLGALISIVAHTVAIAWNIFVAHFREVAEAAASNEAFNFDLSRLGAGTVQHIQTHGIIGLSSVPSWALLLLGFFIHFLSAKEGWDDIADRYFDYKKYDLAAREARQRFDDELIEVRSAAKGAVEAIEAETLRANEDAIDSHNKIRELLALANDRVAEVRDSEDEWVGGGTQLLKVYRDINTEVRDPNSSPEYFSHFPTPEDYRRRTFDVGLTPSTDIEKEARTTREAMKELEELEAKAKERQREIQELCNDVHRFITAAIKKLDKRIEAEEAAVTTAAKQALENEGEWNDPPTSSTAKRTTPPPEIANDEAAA